MIVFARWSAMILAFPTVTAFGVASTAWVWSSSEIFKVLSPPVVVDVEVAPYGLAAVVVVVRRGVAPGAAPGTAPSAPAPAAAPGSVNAWTITGKTSAAEIYRSGRVTGLANSTLASNSATSFRTNGMLIGRVITWMRLVRTSADSLIFPTTTDSSVSAVNAPRSLSTVTCCGEPGGRTPRTPGYPGWPG